MRNFIAEGTLKSPHNQHARHTHTRCSHLYYDAMMAAISQKFGDWLQGRCISSSINITIIIRLYCIATDRFGLTHFPVTQRGTIVIPPGNRFLAYWFLTHGTGCEPAHLVRLILERDNQRRRRQQQKSTRRVPKFTRHPRYKSRSPYNEQK